MKIAITGKGGVGKTTIAAILSRTLARSGAAVVAVDADPNPNLAIALGLGLERAAQVQGVVNVLLEEKAAHSHDHDHSRCETGPQGAEQLLDELGVWAPDGVRLVQTGRIERPAAGCLCCGSHRTSRRLFDELDAGERVLVADLEAGINDLLWVWPKAEDVVLLITEPYLKSVEVTKRALEVISDMEVTQALVVANRVQTREEVEDVRAHFPQSPVAVVPEDAAVMEAASAGLSPMDVATDSPAVQAVAALAATVLNVSSTDRSPDMETYSAPPIL